MRANRSANSSTAVGPRKRVLLVEDSDDIRAVLRSILEEHGLEVVEAVDGAEGLDRLHDDPNIGLVFLDMYMPGMDGLEVLRARFREPTLADVPVVLMTGAAAASMDDARNLGAVGVLQKPVRYEAIVNVARRYVPAAALGA